MTKKEEKRKRKEDELKENWNAIDCYKKGE